MMQLIKKCMGKINKQTNYKNIYFLIRATTKKKQNEKTFQKVLFGFLFRSIYIYKLKLKLVGKKRS